MICAYLDDAGNTGADLGDSAQPIHYNGAILVKDSLWTEIRNQAREIRKYARSKGYEDQIFEFHGVHIFQGQRTGNGWKQVLYQDRLEIYRRCLEILSSLHVPLVIGCCNKPALKDKYAKPYHPHAIATVLCLERIARYASSNHELAIVIADDCSPFVKDISRKVFHEYKGKGAPYGVSVDLNPVIDTMHFMDSSLSPHIQLCDLALYAIRRFEATKDPGIKELAKTALSLIVDRQTIP